MKHLFIKDFEDAPGIIIKTGEIVELWSETAKRAVKEKAAVPVPEGIDEQIFKDSIINKKQK